MIEIYCVAEDPREDDFVVLLRKKESGEWGGIELPDEAILAPVLEEITGAPVMHVWPLCDRVQDEPPPEDTGDRRDATRRTRTFLGALLSGEGLVLHGEWAAVPFEDAAALAGERVARVLALARQGAWIHKVSQVEA